MITVISGTNRRKSNSIVLSEFIRDYLDRKERTELLDLAAFPPECIHPDMYEEGRQHDSIRALQDKYMLPADKFVFVIPEYNGGSPGILKLFIDACSSRAYQQTFTGKKALLIGVATGRAGNLRGLEHFSSIMNYLGVVVYPTKQPISRIQEMVDGTQIVADAETRSALSRLLDGFLSF